MKKALILLLFIPFLLNAQEAITPFKKCNTIKIKNTTLTNFKSHLLKSGYTIDKYLDEGETLETHSFKLWKSSGQTGILIAFADGENVHITGIAAASSFGSNTTMKMESRGTGNMAGKLFQLVNETASDYAGQNHLQISYLKL